MFLEHDKNSGTKLLHELVRVSNLLRTKLLIIVIGL